MGGGNQLWILFGVLIVLQLIPCSAEEAEKSDLGQSLQWIKQGTWPEPVLSRLKLQSAKKKLLKASSDGTNIPDFPVDNPFHISPINTGDFSYFEVKHLFNNGEFPAGATEQIDSFKKFLGDEEFLRKYLFDLNVNLVRGGILPEFRGNQFEKWMGDISKGGRLLSIVDVDLKTLKEDINPVGPYQSEAYTTNKAYRMTQVEFFPDGELVKVMLGQYETQIRVKVSESGKIYHFDGFLSKSPVQGPKQGTAFTKDDLVTIAVYTQEIWGKIGGIPKKGGVPVLDPNNPEYIRIRSQYEDGIKNEVYNKNPVNPTPKPSPEGPGKGGGGSGICTSSGEGCAVIIDPESGKVKVDFDKFVEEYGKANEVEKRRLADLVGKADIKGAEVKTPDFEIARNLVELEDIKKQNVQIKTIDEVLDLENGADFKSSEKIEKMHFAFQDENIRISPSRLSWALKNSKIEELTNKLNKFTAPIGAFMLGATLFNGLQGNDTISQAILLSRLDFDVAWKLGSQIGRITRTSGELLFKETNNVFKFSKFLDKFAGPVAAGLDFESGLYFLTKSLQEISQDEDVYDMEDAIVDVVGDCLNLLISGAELVAYAFGPAIGDLAMAIGTVLQIALQFIEGFIHARIMVGRINHEVQLSSGEKWETFYNHMWDWLGVHQDNYEDLLYKEKQINNAVVESYAELLKNHSEMRSVTWPSKTLKIDKSCRLMKSICTADAGWLSRVFGCASYSTPWEMGNGCDWNKPCPNLACTDHSDGHVRLRCICEDLPKEYPSRSDQTVDFRRTQAVYLDRAGPSYVDKNKGEFKCTPGVLNFQDRKMSKGSTENVYLCENAISLNRPRSEWKDGQFNYIALENGRDTIYGNLQDSTPNIVQMGNSGVKKFGPFGEGQNQFVFGEKCDSSLKGDLIGGRGFQDGIVLGDECGKGMKFLMDFEADSKAFLKMVSQSTANLDFDLKDIEEFTGRAGETEEVTVSCSARKIASQGGKLNAPDIIKFPKKLTVNGMECRYNLTVVASENTVVDAGNGKEGNLTLVFDNRTSNISLVKSLNPNNSSSRFFMVFAATPISNLTNLRLINGSNSINLSLATTYAPKDFVNFTFATDVQNWKDLLPPILFTENNGMFRSILFPSTDGLLNSSLAFHNLTKPDSNSAMSRKGCSFLSNRVEVSGKGWSRIETGEKDDQVVLHFPVKEIHLGGGVDTVQLHQDLTEPIEMDLNGGKFAGIENVVSNTGKKLKLTCSCETQTVVGFGGWNNTANITVPKIPCLQRKLQIYAKGRSSVTIQGPVRNYTEDGVTVVVLGRNSSEEGKPAPLDFDLSTETNDTKGQGKSCRLMKSYCTADAGIYSDLFGCANYSTPEEIGNGCDWNKPCPTEPCTDQSNGHVRTRCICEMPKEYPSRSDQTAPLDFDLSTETNDTKGLVVAVHLQHGNWTVLNYSSSYGKKDSFGVYKVHLELTGVKCDGPLERIRFQFAVNTSKEVSKYAEIPFVQFNLNELSGRLLIEAETGKPSIHFVLGENATKVEGFVGIQNFFEIRNSSWKVTGGNENDHFYLNCAAVEGTEIDGGGGDDNTLVVLGDGKDKQEIFVVNLEKGVAGFLETPEEKANIKGIQSVIGRDGKADELHANCETRQLNGQGGKSFENVGEDKVFISGVNCDSQNIFLIVPDFTTVRNGASTGRFTYLVSNLTTADLQLLPTNKTQHFIYFLFNPWTLIKQVEFDKKTEQMSFKFLEGFSAKTGSVSTFLMSRNETNGSYSNPYFEFNPGSSVVSTVEVEQDGSVVGTYRISGTQDETVQGLDLDVNKFIVNITKPEVNTTKGKIIGSSGANQNLFYIFGIANQLQLIDGGECTNCTNYLHLDSHFESTSNLEIDLDGEDGFIKDLNTSKTYVSSVKNFHGFSGRTSNTTRDKVKATCQVHSVTNAEEVLILYKNTQNEPLRLVISLGKETSVRFVEEQGFNRSAYNGTEDFFKYEFTSPRLFNLDGDEGFTSWLVGGPTHIFAFDFNLGDLQKLYFNKDKEQICYAIKEGTFCYSMLLELNLFEQFYSQPKMTTKDGFNIQVSRVGSIQITTGGSSSFPSQAVIESEVIPSFEAVANRLDCSILVQTDKDFLYLGHDDGFKNVLGNVGHSTSHLVSGGRNDTVYEVNYLVKDVYIYPGVRKKGKYEEVEGKEKAKQTIYLGKVVTDIRLNSGEKYVPKVTQNGNNLVIFMEGNEKKYPGKVIIVNGTDERIWTNLQSLFGQTAFDFYKEEMPGGPEWKLTPRALRIQSGGLQQVAPEDLEDGQELIFQGFEKANTSFVVAVKTETDLYVSNVLDKERNGTGHISRPVTTFIIKDFFKWREWKPPPPVTVKKSLKYNGLIESVPPGVKDVTLTAPGLQLVLNDRQVFKREDSTPEDQEDKPILEKAVVQDWKCVMYQAEKSLLESIPNGIQPVYYAYECEDYPWTAIGSVIGVFIAMVFLLLGVVAWRKQEGIVNCWSRLTRERDGPGNEVTPLLGGGQSCGYRSI